MTDILNRLSGVRKAGDGWTARCPAHDDKQNSLSAHHRDGKWLLKCHAGCDVRQIITACGLSLADLFDEKNEGEGVTIAPATAQPSNRRGYGALHSRLTPRVNVSRWISSVAAGFRKSHTKVHPPFAFLISALAANF